MPLNPHTKGGSDVPVTDGGTGSSTGSGALANLGGLDETAHDLLDHTGLTGVGDLTTVAHAIIDHSSIPGSGNVVQQVYSEIGTVINASGTIPIDNTIPQSSEGTQLRSLSISPSSLSNFLLIEASGYVIQANQEWTAAALFQTGGGGSSSNAIATAMVHWLSVGLPNGSGSSWKIRRRIAVPALGSLTFTVRGGSTVAPSTWGGGSGSVNLYGGTSYTTFSITEITP